MILILSISGGVSQTNTFDTLVVPYHRRIMRSLLSTAGLPAVYFHYNSVAFIHSLVMSTIAISKLFFLLLKL